MTALNTAIAYAERLGKKLSGRPQARANGPHLGAREAANQRSLGE